MKNSGKSGFFTPRLPVLSGLCAAAGSLACVGTALGFLGAYGWFFDLFSHFRVQYAAGLAAIGLGFALVRQTRTAIVFLLFALPNLALIAPYYGKAPVQVSGAAPRFRAVFLNLNAQNRQEQAVREFIAAQQPDFIVLAEFSHYWWHALKSLETEYPYFLTEPQDDNFGIALYSKRPANLKLKTFGDAGLPSATAEVETGGKRFVLAGTHPWPPVGAEYAGWRDRQLADIGKTLAGLPMPVLVLGDLNATPWSAPFRALLAQTQWHDASISRGVQPTWPTQMPLLMIPLDHCLYSDGIVILDKRIGGPVGSDHYPIIVDFALGNRGS